LLRVLWYITFGTKLDKQAKKRNKRCKDSCRLARVSYDYEIDSYNFLRKKNKQTFWALMSKRH